MEKSKIGGFKKKMGMKYVSLYFKRLIHQDSTRNVTSASDLWHQDSLQICIDSFIEGTQNEKPC